MNQPRSDKPALRVLQILPALNAGGVERTTVDIVEALIMEGHKAHVLSAGGRLEKEIKELGGRLHTNNIGSKNILTIISRILVIKKLIRDCDINIVHARSRAPAWPAYFASKLTRTPFVTTYHGIYNAKSWPKTIYNSVMARSDAIIANSNFTRDHIIRTHRINSDDITVIHRGVDMALFDPKIIDTEKVTSQRLEWGTLTDKFIILPGRLTRWKGQLDALEAIAKLPKNYKLILVGDPQGRQNYVDEIKHKIKELQLENRVIITGHRTDMPFVLSCADAVLSASNEPEAFGRVAAEAQAMGKPVIATAIGGALETVEHGSTGFLVPVGDSDKMAEAIKQAVLWTDYDSHYAWSRIHQEFSRKSLQTKTLNVYQALIS